MNTPSRFRPPAPSDSLLATIRANLTRLRTAADISPESLSDAAGLSPSAVRLIETGYSKPALGTLEAVATALGVGLSDLFAEPPKRISRKS
jgi:transcriptional regulator with XRE-family HTH domain